MLLDGEYPKDIRVRKEAESLVEMGFSVLVVCPRKSGLLEEESHNGVLIYRFGKNYTFYKKGIYDILGAINFVNPFFKRGLRESLRKFKIDHIHVHDLPLAKTALKFKNKISGKVILDLHENYPEGLKIWGAWKTNSLIRLKDKVFFNYRKWFNYEKKMVWKVDQIIAVVDEMKERLVKIHEIDRNKVVVVTNSEKIDFQQNKSNSKLIDSFQENFTIAYVGGIGPHRGLDTAILGMEKIKETIPEAKLIIIGSGSEAVIGKLKSIIHTKQLSEQVIFLGFHPFSEVWGVMKGVNVNIIPHASNTHTNNTIPHKLYQIMMSGSPLLVSSCKPLKRIVENIEGGFVFKADDPTSFSEKVNEIYKDKVLVEQRARNAYKAVTEGSHNWENESLKLKQIYLD